MKIKFIIVAVNAEIRFDTQYDAYEAAEAQIRAWLDGGSKDVYRIEKLYTPG